MEAPEVVMAPVAPLEAEVDVDELMVDVQVMAVGILETPFALHRLSAYSTELFWSAASQLLERQHAIFARKLGFEHMHEMFNVLHPAMLVDVT